MCFGPCVWCAMISVAIASNLILSLRGDRSEVSLLAIWTFQCAVETLVPWCASEARPFILTPALHYSTSGVPTRFHVSYWLHTSPTKAMSKTQVIIKTQLIPSYNLIWYNLLAIYVSPILSFSLFFIHRHVWVCALCMCWWCPVYV